MRSPRRLLNASSVVIDSYTYNVAKVEDESTCRLPDITTNDFGFGEWYIDCTPTPNLANTREGGVPSMPGGMDSESVFCDLPDTLPADFFFAECRGYGANIWNADYWDQPESFAPRFIPQNTSKRDAIIE